MTRFEASNVLHYSKLQTKIFLRFQLVCQKIKILHRIKFNQENFTKLLKRMHQFSTICCAVLITKQLTGFVKLGILSNRQRVYEFIFRSYFWKISHVSLLVFLSQEFSELDFLQIWFIISGRWDNDPFYRKRYFLDMFQPDWSRLLAIDLKRVNLNTDTHQGEWFYRCKWTECWKDCTLFSWHNSVSSYGKTFSTVYVNHCESNAPYFEILYADRCCALSRKPFKLKTHTFYP